MNPEESGVLVQFYYRSPLYGVIILPEASIRFWN